MSKIINMFGESVTEEKYQEIINQAPKLRKITFQDASFSIQDQMWTKLKTNVFSLPNLNFINFFDCRADQKLDFGKPDLRVVVSRLKIDRNLTSYYPELNTSHVFSNVKDTLEDITKQSSLYAQTFPLSLLTGNFEKCLPTFTELLTKVSIY